MEKGGDSRPLFYCGRGRLTVSCRPSSSRPWLSSPLCSIPPFMWVSRVASSVAAAWHAHAIAIARVLHLGHKEWLQRTILIPDVDYGCVICYVKHKVLQKVKKFRSPSYCTRLFFQLAQDERASFRLGESSDTSRVVHTITRCAIGESLPRSRARALVVQIQVVCFRDALQEEWVSRIAFVERSQERHPIQRPMFVPEVDEMQLVVGLAAQQLAGVTCA